MTHVALFITIASGFGQVLGRLTVETSFGKLIGKRPYPTLPGTCEQFLGIPYAKPPTGPLRFADTVPWTDPYPASGRDATKYQAVCPQLGLGKEDCLFLNVWRPSKTTAGKGLAVMVWIHGGAFVTGAGSTLPGATALTNIYNGCTLSTFHNVMVVSLNYRLGPLGFATFEDENGCAGNFGMKDQRQALVWLQSELAAFGGDPAKVTIFGESAGGESIFYHMASPLSKGLFHGAISESGFPAAHDWSYRQELTRSFASKLQCNDKASLRECLRTKYVNLAWQKASIGNTSNALLADDWGPVVDGVDMPETPAKIFYDGRSHSVPFMAGSNTNEANLMVWPLYELGMSKSQFKGFAQKIADDYRRHNSVITLNAAEMAKVYATYPASTGKGNRPLASDLGTDLCFVCATHLAAQSHASHADMFVYRFNHRSSCQIPDLPILPGVYHGSEITYVFGDPEFGACVLGAEEDALSLRMQVMWTNFAKNLDPVSPKEAFPKYTNSTRLSMVLQTPTDTIESNYRDDYCNLWRDVVYSKLFNSVHHAYDVVV